MLLLDLFCGAGGAAVGYHRAGFEVVGIDHRKFARFPYDFVQADALTFLQEVGPGVFDAIHASPPCQRWSRASYQSGRNGSNFHPDLIGQLRTILRTMNVPYIIENVETAPLEDPVVLCGTRFPGLRVIRHRAFECNFPLSPRPCVSHPKVLHPYDARRIKRRGDEWTEFLSITGGSHSSLAAAQDAMGIDWMSRRQLVQAIPPAYTEYIGRELLKCLSNEVRGAS